MVYLWIYLWSNVSIKITWRRLKSELPWMNCILWLYTASFDCVEARIISWSCIIKRKGILREATWTLTLASWAVSMEKETLCARNSTLDLFVASGFNLSSLLSGLICLGVKLSGYWTNMNVNQNSGPSSRVFAVPAHLRLSFLVEATGLGYEDKLTNVAISRWS